MVPEVLTFGISFLIIYSILVWLVIKLDTNNLIKFVLIIAMSIFTFSCWKSAGDLLGFATSDDIPEEFVIIGVGIIEPSKSIENPTKGGIYLLLQSDDHNLNPFSFTTWNTEEPRLYKLEYSKDKHAQALQLLKRLGKGEKIKGLNRKSEKPKAKGNNNIQYHTDDEQLFYELPKNQILPKK